MKYGTIGTNTSASEVTDISTFGIWILHRGKEYFLPYENFPWFRDATINQIFTVVDEGKEHLRWPELDVDLSLESILDPGAYPMVYEPKTPYNEEGDSENPDLLSS